jgi:molybdate/tungstate transport system substrate-binding protein
VLDTFAARTRAVVQRESGGSLEHARKLTELGRIPDALILADEEVFGELLAPRFVNEWTAFARNRMVVAYTDRSLAAGEIDPSNWTEILSRRGVQVGRTDPETAPAGYRTLIVLELAALHYGVPGLSRRLLDNAPPRNVRGNAAELAGLLAAGELDYIYEYRSLALANGFRILALPPEIDLGDAARAESYSRGTARVRGAEGSYREIAGRPILFASAVPLDAPHPRAARQFAAFFESDEARAMLEQAHVHVLEQPVRKRLP